MIALWRQSLALGNRQQQINVVIDVQTKGMREVERERVRARVKWKK